MSKYEERKIGKKAWLFRECQPNSWNFILDKSKVYSIESVVEPKDCNDYCYHYVVKAEDGSIEEVREFMVLVCPETDNGKDEMYNLEKYIDDNEVYADEVYKDGLFIAVHCEWGDWKHTHAWLRSLMQYIGYVEVSEKVTEDNGSDCYSATHYFIKRQS